VTAAAGGNGALASWARLIRAAADLIEQAGVPRLVLYPEPDKIVIQVPEDLGDVAARTRAVARIAALTGAAPAPDPRPGVTRGWILARGHFAGHPVHVFAPVSQEPAL
jgi:hypothetical protein